MILITGWTGNTGSFVLKKIREKFPHKEIIGISRSHNGQKNEGILVEIADLSKEDQVRAVFEKYRFETIIHIANIRYSSLLMQLANTYRVPHIIMVHTTGIYSKYQAYSSLYKEIEESILKKSYENTTFTILRPTMIYGNSRDHNMHKLIRFLARSPVFPVFGDGSAVMQPVHVEDLAAAIVACVNNEKAKNKDYDLSGGTVVTYKEILQMIIGLLQKKVIFFHVPLKLAIGLASIYGKLSKKPLISVEQIERLQEDKSYPFDKAAADLNYHPRSFFEGIKQEISELKKEGLI
ncbi:NAD-dependent epimerase/dehydratase family protein [Effusibacillus lacus]|uniref:NAD-dependent epimerase/dehydratase domain-containing protein n=1 Tax=Effusibacillus lacus TaxID=1348429 RepID=A0A292YU79_9BACL|nr:NAD-dependent epimerase/dehydratase family protein [Effusibacillus lacus]TCS73732.1 nucleoside-diphosphate-sugar epimerase [Effusibacillus lacus]GAX92055.1 hypothetical protein EFBL_3746 [Effusibacillus lacus]